MKKYLCTAVLLMAITVLAIVYGTREEVEKDSGYRFEDGTLYVSKIYYTVLDVVGNPRCVYEEPWVSYKNRGEIKNIVIDADMVFTETNYQTGEQYKDIAGNTTDFLGGGVLFGNMDSLESIKIKRLNLDNITDISKMFANNKNLKEADVSGLEMSGVTDASYLFSGSESLTSIDLNGLDTSCLINAEGLLEGCSALETAAVSSWNTANIVNFRHFFYQCSSLSAIDLDGWKINNADVAGMLWGCDSLSSVNLTNVNLTDTIAANAMFDEHNSLSSYMFASDWDIRNVNPINDDVYDFVIEPVIGHPTILFIEYIYYTKEMPDWYKDYVVRIQALEDCDVFPTPLCDIYVKEDRTKKYAGKYAENFDFNDVMGDVVDDVVDDAVDDIMDYVKDNLSKMIEFDEQNATDAELKLKAFLDRLAAAADKAGKAYEVCDDIISYLKEYID